MIGCRYIGDKKGPVSSSTGVDYYCVGGRPGQRSGQTSSAPIEYVIAAYNRLSICIK